MIASSLHIHFWLFSVSFICTELSLFCFCKFTSLPMPCSPQAYIEAAENMLEDDVASNKAIGTFGSSLLRQQAKNPDKLSVLTHCNTGRYGSVYPTK